MKPDELETRLRLNYPELASAQVDVYLPNLVYVSVSERQPLILWQQGDGFTWIDASGVAFRPRGQANGLIPVTSLAVPPAGDASRDDPLSPPQYIQKDLVDAILVLAPNVPAGSTLTYHGTDGLGWKDSRGWDIFFGISAADMALKLRVYQSLVDSLAARGQVPVYINVAYPDAPYYRMSQFTGFDPTNESE
jgi:cell division septal protein FtsQ